VRPIGARCASTAAPERCNLSTAVTIIDLIALFASDILQSPTPVITFCDVVISNSINTEEMKMPKTLIDLVRPQLLDQFKDRWKIPDWRLHFPWWVPPASCRILMYADNSVHLSGGGFQGLTYVKTLLESHAYFYVKFTVDFCHRDGTDPSATVNPYNGMNPNPKKLTDLDIINNYDEIWFFGYNSGQALDPLEVSAMDNFMAAPKFGGVLTTGDHASLGQALSGQLTRVGQMRLYPAPPNIPPTWNTTLDQRPVRTGEPADPPGPSQPYNFDDQSDDIPQTIRWKRYWANILFQRPHPLLCGPDGPIDVLPDHEHEGEALAPLVAGDARWPTKNGIQEVPEVIAWGKIKDPIATKYGQEIGVISAYNGHQVDVGRIAADSTWHHWFDINLIGLAGSGLPYTGFVATPIGQAALKKIDGYYLNCGVWLAPPSVQTAMRNAAWWSILWQDIVIELPADAHIRFFGATGIDALGRRAPRCAVFDWVWPKEPIYKPKIPWYEWVQIVPELDFVNIPIEEYMAGGILRELTHSFGPHNGKRSISDKPPSDKELSHAIAKGTETGLTALKQDLQRQYAGIGKLMERDFLTKG
jgi:hypothetical protein